MGGRKPGGIHVTYPSDEPDLEAVCEFLGLVDDADSHATYATEAHRCYRLANPTRIASAHQETYCLGANHETCPIFLGEGVAQTTRTASRPPAREVPVLEAGTVRTAGAPPARQGAAQRPPQRQRPAGPGPRPRPGGISMPAATIGLLILAAAIIGLAFLVQNLLGSDDDTPAGGDPVATRAAQTQTAQAAQTQATNPAETGTQGANTPGTPQTTTTPAATRTQASTTTTPGAGQVHVVEAGEFCGDIAALYGVTVEEIIEANPDVGADCAIFAGQELIIP